MLIFGSFADRVGRRRIFVIGLAAFSVSSLACGLATDPVVLDVLRGIQGLGGAAMLATSLALIAAAYEGRQRATALAVWGATTAAAVAIGPLVGGALVEAFGWESIFFVNVPIGLVTAALVARGVPESRDPSASGRADYGGLVTLASAMTLAILALFRGNEEGWGSGLIVGLFAGSAILLAAFIAIERRREQPLLDLALFRKPSTWGASLGILMIAISVFANLTFLVFYIQNALGYDALETGLRLFPLTIASFFAAAIAGRMTDKVPVRFLIAAGLACAGVGLLLNRQVEVGSDWTALLAGGIFVGIGAGMVNPSVAAAAIGTAPVTKSGMASGLNSTFRLLGVAVGVALLGAIVEHEVSASLAQSLPVAPPHALIDVVATGNVDAATAFAQSNGGPDISLEAETAFVHGFDTIQLVSAAIAFTGAALALALVRQRDFVATRGAEPAPAAAG
jgi:EmrB/QacA subfamily drug resistance transporter